MSRMGRTLSTALVALAFAGCQGGEVRQVEPTTSTAGSEHADAHAAAAPQQEMMQGQGGMMHGQGGGMMHGQGGGMMHGQGGGMMHGQGMAAECPMMSQGTRISQQDIDGGVALVITTDDPARVDALRAHVRQMAGMPGQGDGAMGMPPSDAREVDIPNGARLELHARAPEDVAALRERAQEHVAQMRSGECPMMHASASPQRSPT